MVLLGFALANLREPPPIDFPLPKGRVGIVLKTVDSRFAGGRMGYLVSTSRSCLLQDKKVYGKSLASSTLFLLGVENARDLLMKDTVVLPESGALPDRVCPSQTRITYGSR
jgi:hypothetical protein